MCSIQTRIQIIASWINFKEQKWISLYVWVTRVIMVITWCDCVKRMFLRFLSGNFYFFFFFKRKQHRPINILKIYRSSYIYEIKNNSSYFARVCCTLKARKTRENRKTRSSEINNVCNKVLLFRFAR